MILPSKQWILIKLKRNGHGQDEPRLHKIYPRKTSRQGTLLLTQKTDMENEMLVDTQDLVTSAIDKFTTADGLNMEVRWARSSSKPLALWRTAWTSSSERTGTAWSEKDSDSTWPRRPRPPSSCTTREIWPFLFLKAETYYIIISVWTLRSHSPPSSLQTNHQALSYIILISHGLCPF